MAILKSEVVGKPISSLKGITTGGKHPIWYNFTIDAVDFLSRCTLRYSKSCGASYKIDPTSELTIIHTDGTKYPVDSYEKLLTMVITDYDEPQEQPMPTKPQPGTHWERLKDLADHSPKGEIVTVERVTTTFISFSGGRDLSSKEFLNRFKPRPDLDTPASEPTQRRRLAFYKESGTPWTADEYINISKYCGDKPSERQFSRFNDPNSHKYVYDDADTSDFMYNWNSKTPEEYPEDYTILSYESVFGTPAVKPTTDDVIKTKLKVGDSIGYNKAACRELSHSNPILGTVIGTIVSIKERTSPQTPCVTYKNLQGNHDMIDEGWVEVLPKPSTKTTKPVAQLEPIIPTPIKETFMSKIKASASATVDQNKQALVIASKMEAGRIINKQVLKQLKPHLPFFLQGYASSPFAPFVAANLVAMVANHTGNSKLTRVSDLMLLGAADSGVTAFNLDKIVDDILSNIKLPAGVLDDSDNE